MTNKCKNCGGELNFDIETQQLKCTHCSSLFPFQKEVKPLDKKNFTNESTIKKSHTKYTQFLCKTCGRKHISPVDTPLTHCPSCGDTSLEKTLKVEYTPDGILPFRVTKQLAQQNLLKWLKKRPFVPNDLKKLAKTHSLTGVYIPAYVYDFSCSTNYSGVGVTKHISSKNNITYSKHSFASHQNNDYINYIESAGSTIPSVRLRTIGNYTVDKVYAYSTEYLYGWIGEQVNSDLQANCRNMQNDVSQDIAFSIKNSLNYDSIENFHCSTSFSNIKYNYIYLPIWKGVYKYKNKPYSYFVNGQSGRVYGRTPKSFWKIFFTCLGIGIAIGLFAYICSL